MKLALLGGFLGSGKTTALVQACTLLMNQGKKVGVITNDQGNQQVDSAFVRSFGIATREVSNGCFCCNFHELEKQMDWLMKNELPDIIFAESVGSCTDLVATLVKPLQQLQPDLEIAVSIFADAGLIASLLESKVNFLDEEVQYIYKKQLEEADLIILNKIDTITPEQFAMASITIRSEYPEKAVLAQNSLREADVAHWLNLQDKFTAARARHSLDLDYTTYGAGEARLAWLDKSIQIQTATNDAALIARKIVGNIFNRIQMEHLPVGHLKFFLKSGDWSEKISFTATSTGEHIASKNAPSTNSTSLLINARVQTQPEKLTSLVDSVLINAQQAFRCSIAEEQWAVFAPGFPRPTHRLA